MMLSIGQGILKIIFGKTRHYARITHFIGRLKGEYYFEDYDRVYPDGLRLDRFGSRMEYTRMDLNNFLNHQKFYKFAAQFVNGKVVSDIGCGSGYGCKILNEGGANKVFGTDISESAISYARRKFRRYGRFSIQTCTDLKSYADDSFDVTVCSEVLEHIKEYSTEDIALEELRRITKRDGIIILATPNNELLRAHGFFFAELSSLMERHFHSFVIFENALLEVGLQTDCRSLWQERLATGKTGVTVSENIDLSETVLFNPDLKESDNLLKEGIPAGTYKFKNIDINTRLLHNTYSFVVVIINDEKVRTVV